MQEFKEGYIYYVKDFPFKNGNAPKDKFFLILKDLDDKMLLASLPTSQDHIPSGIEIHTGSYNDIYRRISAFVFKAGDDIATNNGELFHFIKDTFVYGEEIDTFPKCFLDNNHVEIRGKLKDDLFQQIIDTFKNSPVVKKKYRNML